MSKEKLEKIQKLIENEIETESTNISEHRITFSFPDNKSVTLDFNQDYLRHLKDEDIPNIIETFNIIGLIEGGHETINISEQGATPYLGSKS